MYPWKKSLNTRLLPGVTWVTKDLVWVCTGVKFVVTTADAVTDVTARTPWVDAMVTSSVEAAGAAAVRCWVWTTCAAAVPPDVWKGTKSLFFTASIPHIQLRNLLEMHYIILETKIKSKDGPHLSNVTISLGMSQKSASGQVFFKQADHQTLHYITEILFYYLSIFCFIFHSLKLIK